MNIARIKGGFVVNTEVADAEWVAAHEGVDGFTFIPYDDQPRSADGDFVANVPHIGLGFDPETGLFEQPPLKEESHG